MRIFLSLLVLMALAACGGSSPTQKPTNLTPTATRHFSIVPLPYEAGKKLSNQLKDEYQKAAALGRKPFVEFGASWCPPCIAIQNSLDDPRMAEAFKDTYIIQMDLDEWQNHLAGTDFRVVAIPIYHEIDKNGRATGRSLSGGAWGADTPDKMAPVLKKFLQK